MHKEANKKKITRNTQKKIALTIASCLILLTMATGITFLTLGKNQVVAVTPSKPDDDSNIIERINALNKKNQIVPYDSSISSENFDRINQNTVINYVKFPGIEDQQILKLKVSTFSRNNPNVSFKLTDGTKTTDLIVVSFKVYNSPSTGGSLSLVDKVNQAIKNKTITPLNKEISSSEFDSIISTNVLSYVNIPGVEKSEYKLLTVDSFVKNKPEITFMVINRGQTSNAITITWKIVD